MMKNTTQSLLKKLADFKLREINIPKDTKAYGYNYAPLDTILPIIEPVLADLGLSYFHRTDYDPQSWRTYLETVIYEVDGEGFITSRILIDEEVVLAKMNKFMVLGSALTYFRRYHLVTMLGLLTDEDTDAGAAPGSGRSVESITREKDWTKTFVGLIEAEKTYGQIMAFYNTYEKTIPETQIKEVQDLINGSFPNAIFNDKKTKK